MKDIIEYILIIAFVLFCIYPGPERTGHELHNIVAKFEAGWNQPVE